MDSSSDNLFSKKNIISYLIMAILIVAIPVAVKLVQTQQLLKSRAAGGGEITVLEDDKTKCPTQDSCTTSSTTVQLKLTSPFGVGITTTTSNTSSSTGSNTSGSTSGGSTSGGSSGGSSSGGGGTTTASCSVEYHGAVNTDDPYTQAIYANFYGFGFNNSKEYKDWKSAREEWNKDVIPYTHDSVESTDGLFWIREWMSWFQPEIHPGASSEQIAAINDPVSSAVSHGWFHSPTGYPGSSLATARQALRKLDAYGPQWQNATDKELAQHIIGDKTLFVGNTTIRGDMQNYLNLNCKAATKTI